jgi:ABC-type oligopeptide transport system substrate-binding subunit
MLNPQYQRRRIMTKQLTNRRCIISFAVLSMFMVTIAGCSSGTDLTTEFSGKWKNEQDNSTVVINLAKDSSSMVIDGHTYKGVVDTIDKGTQTVHVKVTSDGGNTEIWSLHQVWNDNGSAFKLKLRRNGAAETLVPVGHS